MWCLRLYSCVWEMKVCILLPSFYYSWFFKRVVVIKTIVWLWKEGRDGEVKKEPRGITRLTFIFPPATEPLDHDSVRRCVALQRWKQQMREQMRERDERERLLHIDFFCILLWITYTPVAGQRHERMRKSPPDHRIQLHVHLRAPSLMRQLTNCSLKRREVAGVELEQFILRLSSLSQKRTGSCPVSGGTVTPSVGTQTYTHTQCKGESRCVKTKTCT